MTGPSTPQIGMIGEGHGEDIAFPILLRRICQGLDPALYVDTLPPIRRPKGSLIRAGGIEDAMLVVGGQIGRAGGVFVLIDADDDCPATLGPDLLRRAGNARSDRFCSVVLANREYEAWFLAAAESLRRVRGLAADLTTPNDPEARRGAAEWLTEHMPGSHAYRKREDQPALTAIFDLEAARTQAPSFAKLDRDVERLLKAFQH